MTEVRGPDTVRVSNVKGHTTREFVQRGSAMTEDQFGNYQSHDAAKLGRGRQSAVVMDDRRVWMGTSVGYNYVSS